jgi:hypothetical protein
MGKTKEMMTLVYGLEMLLLVITVVVFGLNFLTEDL